MFLRKPLPVTVLEQLLRLQSGAVQLALHRCKSILVIPNGNSRDSVRPHHASLRYFLTDHSQAKDWFLDARQRSVFILVDCIKVIMAELESDVGGEHLDCAC